MTKQDRDIESVPIQPVFETVLLREALDRAWRILDQTQQVDIAEINAKASCKLAAENDGDGSEIVTTFVYPGRKPDDIPASIRAKEDGDSGLYIVQYKWPQEKVLLIDQVQAGLERTMDQTVACCYWEGE